jgi:uncharacterized small protein (DUF1192 family)
MENQPSMEEMDARLAAVISQRENALNEVVLLRARLTILSNEIEKLKTPPPVAAEGE